MADVKTRVTVVGISHEGGPLSNALGDSLKVTPASYDAVMTVSGTGKSLSRATTGNGALDAVDLRGEGFLSIHYLYAANKATTGSITVTLFTSEGQVVLPVKAGGVGVLASKSGQYVLAAAGNTLTVNAPLGAQYEVAVAGNTSAT